jgi:hypothetical protein
MCSEPIPSSQITPSQATETHAELERLLSMASTLQAGQSRSPGSEPMIQPTESTSS